MFFSALKSDASFNRFHRIELSLKVKWLPSDFLRSSHFKFCDCTGNCKTCERHRSENDYFCSTKMKKF